MFDGFNRIIIKGKKETVKQGFQIRPKTGTNQIRRKYGGNMEQNRAN